MTNPSQLLILTLLLLTPAGPSLAAAASGGPESWRTHVAELRQASPGRADSLARVLLERPTAARTAMVDTLIERLHAEGRPAVAHALSARLLAVLDEPGAAPPGPRALAHGRHARLCDAIGDRTGQVAEAELAMAIAVGAPELSRGDRAGLFEETAMALREASRFDEARTCLDSALALRSLASGPRSAAAANTLRQLTSLERRAGRLADARRALDLALDIAEHLVPRDSLQLLDFYNVDAILLADIGRDEPAARRFLHCAALSRRLAGSNDRRTAQFLYNAALAAQRLGRNREAAAYHEEALALRFQVGDRGGIRESHLGVASNLLALGQPDSAEARIQLVLSQVDLARESPLVLADPLGILASAHMRRGRWAAADSVFARVLDLRGRMRPLIHPAYAAAATARAFNLACAGDLGSAMGWAFGADSLSREHLLLAAGGMAETQLLGVVSRRPLALDLALSLASVRPEVPLLARTYDAVIRSRALVLDELALRHARIMGVSDPGVAALRESLAVVQRGLVQQLSGDPRAADRGSSESFSALERRRESIEGELGARSRAFARVRGTLRAGSSEISAALPPGSILVSFVQYQARRSPAIPEARGSLLPVGRDSVPHYAAFVLRATATAPEFVPLGAAARIDSLILSWRASASSMVTSPLRRARHERRTELVGRALYVALWKPLEPWCRGAAQVFIVPTGAIHLVPLGALPSPEPGRFLIEGRTRLHLLSAERDLLLPAEPPSTGPLLCLAAPEFGPRGSAAVTPCAGLGGLRFDALPATRREGEEIAALWDSLSERAHPNAHAVRAIRLSGAGATEAEFQRLAPGARVLHVATHGFFQEDCGGERGVSLAATNPLLRTGLALAGANQRKRPSSEGTDGLLLAAEVGGLDLRGVEWVVLSACDTGRGTLHAHEGVLGLRRAFSVAGARTVIMSLWPVGDAAARGWMPTLYRERFGVGRSTAEACRNASLAFLARARAVGASTHPSAWAAFVAVGDWR